MLHFNYLRCSTHRAREPERKVPTIKGKKWGEKGKNKIIWRLHQFFMNFHLDWESPLTAIDRSSCCHASLHLGAAGKPSGGWETRSEGESSHCTPARKSSPEDHNPSAHITKDQCIFFSACCCLFLLYLYPVKPSAILD